MHALMTLLRFRSQLLSGLENAKSVRKRWHSLTTASRNFAWFSSVIVFADPKTHAMILRSSGGRENFEAAASAFAISSRGGMRSAGSARENYGVLAGPQYHAEYCMSQLDLWALGDTDTATQWTAPPFSPLASTTRQINKYPTGCPPLASAIVHHKSIQVKVVEIASLGLYIHMEKVTEVEGYEG